MPRKNLLTLWPDAIRAELIPKPPSIELARAKGGESTFYIAQEAPISPTRSSVTVAVRPALPDELLRNPSLMFIPDWSANLRFRLLAGAAAERDTALRRLQWAWCKSSILYFANTWVWIYDPKAGDETRKHIPFCTFPFQDDVLTWMVWLHAMRQDGLIEKSREMGATWMIQVLYAWLTLFYPGSTVYETSLREEDVDNRQPDSLLGKYRYILTYLPEWMRGGWVEHEGDDKYMSIVIPDTRSFVRGQKVESTAGRQGRATSLAADEFAHIGNAGQALDAFATLSPTTLYISTPKGEAGDFARIAHDPSVNKKRLHHSLHPLKNPEWAKVERARAIYFDDAVWNQEHEVSYSGSVSGRVFPGFIDSPRAGVPWCHAQSGELVRHDPAYDVYSSSDLGHADPCSTLWAQIKPAAPEHVIHTRWTLCIFEHHEARNMTAADLRHLLNSKNYVYREHVVDMRTAAQTDSSKRTWLDNLADANARPEYSQFYGKLILPGPPVNATGKRSWEEPTIDQVRTLLALPGAIAISQDAAPHLIQALNNWGHPLNRNTRQPEPDSKPEHSQWSHACKALCYLVDWLYPLFTGEQSPPHSRSDWGFRTASSRFR